MKMALMKDSECKKIPLYQGENLFDLDLFNWGDRVVLSLNVPWFFEGDDFDYDSAGVLTVPFFDVMNEYLENDFIEDSGIESAQEFINQLESYVDKLKTKLKKPDKT